MPDYADVLHDSNGPDGTTDNQGGTQTVIYYGWEHHFLAIQTPTASPTTVADPVKITTDHTFNTGKKFNKLYVTLDTGQVDYESTGETDAHGYKPMFKGFCPGDTDDLHGLMARMKNFKGIFLIPVTDGKIHQLGSKGLPALFKPKYSTGTLSQGKRGYEIEIMAYATKPYIYSGNIQLTPAP